MDNSLLTRLRAETPTCASLIQLNNAGAALTPTPVMEALLGHLQLEQQIGAYEAAESNAAALENFYAGMARLLVCAPAEIAWMENSTRAWETAVLSIGMQPGDGIITGQSEYASNLLAMLHLQRRLGVEVRVVPTGADGIIAAEAVEAMIDGKTRLIAITHIPSQLGVIQPVCEIGAVAARHNLLYLVDACQSVGQLPLDVGRIGCHLLTGSGRKFLRGPRGTGFLYVSARILPKLVPPAIDLRSAEWTSADSYRLREDARRFETWECYVAGKLALGAAADYAMAVGLEVIQARIVGLASALNLRLRSLPGITVFEPPGSHGGILTFSRQGEAATSVQARLRRAGINIGIARRASCPLDMGRRGLDDVNRVSPHCYNSEEEIDNLIRVLSGRDSE